MSNAESKKNVYDILTERFIEALEKSTVPWQSMHSVTSQSTWPRNAVTGRPFSGVNVALLSMTRLSAGYPHNLWLTFKEAQALGGSVRKGERGTPVFFFSVFEKKDEIDPRTGLPAKRFVLRYTPRFNIAQCDNIKLPKGRIPDAPVPAMPGAELALAQEVSAEYLAREGVPLTHMDTTPHYNIAADSICVPEMGRFTTPAAYYKTLFHEIAHSTGAAKRRKRALNPHKQSEEYSYEELDAEIQPRRAQPPRAILDHWSVLTVRVTVDVSLPSK